jgi:hypothetical protein
MYKRLSLNYRVESSFENGKYRRHIEDISETFLGMKGDGDRSLTQTAYNEDTLSLKGTG